MWPHSFGQAAVLSEAGSGSPLLHVHDVQYEVSYVSEAPGNTTSAETTTRRSELLVRPPEMWHICVKDISSVENILSDKTIFIEAASTDTVAQLKVKLEAPTGILSCAQSIVAGGVEFLNDCTLRGCELVDGSTVYLAIPQPHPQQPGCGQ